MILAGNAPSPTKLAIFPSLYHSILANTISVPLLMHWQQGTFAYHLPSFLVRQNFPCHHIFHYPNSPLWTTLQKLSQSPGNIFNTFPPVLTCHTHYFTWKHRDNINFQRSDPSFFKGKVWLNLYAQFQWILVVNLSSSFWEAQCIKFVTSENL